MFLEIVVVAASHLLQPVKGIKLYHVPSILVEGDQLFPNLMGDQVSKLGFFLFIVVLLLVGFEFFIGKRCDASVEIPVTKNILGDVCRWKRLSSKMVRFFSSWSVDSRWAITCEDSTALKRGRIKLERCKPQFVVVENSMYYVPRTM
ncbi:hypothetical protein B0H16DRAFT_53209 [Mycena metata]|uniref:Transmembrane protein n=1 Tax=Mycena metata TaxID=1033252 RepID=A0AAD7IFX6_9AGAR|nr:hypothetical protein B0H16DRAFT_53209 [Mycena metata]